MSGSDMELSSGAEDGPLIRKRGGSLNGQDGERSSIKRRRVGFLLNDESQSTEQPHTPAMPSAFEMLPFDVLRHLFSHLDKPALLETSLVNKATSELASWELYTSIFINKGVKIGYYTYNTDPFDTFRRRPHLRNAVKEVELYGDGIEYIQGRTGNQLRELPNLVVMTIFDLFGPNAWSFLYGVLRGLELRLLDIRVVGPPPAANFIPNSIAHHLHLSLDSWLLMDESVRSQTHRVQRVACKYYLEMTPNSLSLELAKFVNLQVLELAHFARFTAAELCQLVSSAPSIRELICSCDLTNTKSPMFPTKCRNLAILRLGYYRHRHPRAKYFLSEILGGAKILAELLYYIAGDSNLRYLDIKPTTSRPKSLQGDAVIPRLLAAHRKTLETLKLPYFHLSNGGMEQLLTNSKNLLSLSIGVTESNRARLSQLLPKATAISHLRLCAQGTWVFEEAKSLIQQAHPSLCVFKVYARHKDQFLKSVWKVNWVYDFDLKGPVRQTQGPEKFSGFTFMPKKYRVQQTQLVEDTSGLSNGGSYDRYERSFEPVYDEHWT